MPNSLMIRGGNTEFRSQMVGRASKPALDDTQMGVSTLTSSQTAQYTSELLDSLCKIAHQQNQVRLARLLEEASLEANRLAVTAMANDS